MAVNYDFTRIDRDIWLSLFFGLTQERIDSDNDHYGLEPELPIKPDEWVDAVHSPWFKPDPESDKPLDKHGVEQGWVIMAQHSFVHNVMMALIPCMPAPGWGLSDKNIDEAVRRVLIYQEVTGPLGSKFVGPWILPQKKQRNFWEPYYVTEEEIRKLNGLSVNFSTVNISTFRKTVERCLEEKVAQRAYRAKKEAEEKMAKTG
jgi:hypothetical protein